MSFQSAFSRSILLAGAAATIAGPAYAEGAEDRDYLPRDIVVVGANEAYTSEDGSSGTKTPTALIDVPQAVSVLTRDQLDDQGTRNLNDALRYVPSVSLGTGEGHRDQVLIRGQSSTADFYIDGLRDDAQYYRPLYNVDRVEVLKGANALIFGRGAGGGAINRVSKQADPVRLFGEVSGLLDSFGAHALAGDVNAPLSDSAAIRLNATWEGLNNHRDLFDGRFIGVSPSLTADLGAGSRLTASYSYDDDRRTVDRGIPSLANLPIAGHDTTFFGDETFNRSTIAAHILRSRIEHELADWISFNLTGQYAHYDKYYGNILPSGASATTVTIQGYEAAMVRENLIGQANLVATFETGPIGHTLLAGVEAMSQDTHASRNEVRFTGNAASVTVPLASSISVPAFTLIGGSGSASSLAAWSFYLQEQLAIGEHVQLVAGIRRDVFDLDSINLVSNFAGSRRDARWSPRLGVVVKPVEALSFYASYSESFLPQSGDQFTVLSGTTAALDPEKFENLEAGVKWAIGPDLLATAAIFRLDRSNTQAPDPDNPGFVILTGETRVEGFELGLAGSVTANIHVSLAYTHLDGEITSATSAGPAGRQLQQLPRHQLALWGRHDLTEKFGFGLGLIHQSDQFATISNTTVLPAYVRVDAALYLDDVFENISLQLNVENLFDANYFPSSHNNHNIQPGEPFNASMGARLKF